MQQSHLALKYVKLHSKFKKYGLDYYIRIFSDCFLFFFGPKKMAEFSYIKRESDKLIHVIQKNICKYNKQRKYNLSGKFI